MHVKIKEMKKKDQRRQHEQKVAADEIGGSRWLEAPVQTVDS